MNDIRQMKTKLLTHLINHVNLQKVIKTMPKTVGARKAFRA